jgi:large subunit ribosomal protein L32e
MKAALKARRRIKRKRPSFPRQESLTRLKNTWRRPRGKRSKMRMRKRGRGARPSVGYRSPAAVRGLSPSGRREVLISTINDMNQINPATEIGVIRHSVGARKRKELLTHAAEKQIPVAARRLQKIFK